MARQRQMPLNANARPHFLVQFVLDLIAFMSAEGYEPNVPRPDFDPGSPSDADVEDFVLIPAAGNNPSLLDRRGEQLYRWNATEGRFYCETSSTWLAGPRPRCYAQPGDIHNHHQPVSIEWRMAAVMELQMRFYCSARRGGLDLPETHPGGVFHSRQQRGGHQLNLLHVLFALFRRLYNDAPVRLMHLWAKPIESSPTTTIRKRARACWVGSLDEENGRREWTIFSGFPSTRMWRREQGRVSVANYFRVSRRVEGGDILSGFVDMATTRRVHGLVPLPPMVELVPVIEPVAPGEVAEEVDDVRPMEVDQEGRVEQVQAPRVPPPGEVAEEVDDVRPMEVDQEGRVEQIPAPRVPPPDVLIPPVIWGRHPGVEDLGFMLDRHPRHVNLPVPLHAVPMPTPVPVAPVPAVIVRVPPPLRPDQVAARMRAEVAAAVDVLVAGLGPTAPPRPIFEDQPPRWDLPEAYGLDNLRRLEVVHPMAFFDDSHRIRQIRIQNLEPGRVCLADGHDYVSVEYLDDNQPDNDGLMAWRKDGGGPPVGIDAGPVTDDVPLPPRVESMADRFVGTHWRARRGRRRRRVLPPPVRENAIGWHHFMFPVAYIQRLRSLCSVHRRPYPDGGPFPGRTALVFQYLNLGEASNSGLYAVHLGQELQ